MRTITAARWISLLAAFIWGAVAEYHLALAVGADQLTAGLLPLVLDVWGFAAMKAGRSWHVSGALAAMFGTQMVSHLLTIGNAPKHIIALSIAVSAIPPAVSLACHRLGIEPVTVDAPAVTVTAPVANPGYTAHVAVERFLAPEVPPVDAPVETVPVTADAGEAMTKEEYAAQGAALIAQGATKTAAAESLGISRQWLHRCMSEAAYAG